MSHRILSISYLTLHIFLLPFAHFVTTFIAITLAFLLHTDYHPHLLSFVEIDDGPHTEICVQTKMCKRPCSGSLTVKTVRINTRTLHFALSQARYVPAGMDGSAEQLAIQNSLQLVLGR